MARILSIALVIVMSCLPSIGFHQPSPLNDMLQKQITVPAQQTLPGIYIGAALRASGLRSGIEEKDNSCASTPTQYFPEFRGPIEGVIRSVKSPDGERYSWEEKVGILFIRNAPEKTSLLDTQIAKFSFEINEDPLALQDRLFDLPEVRKRAAELKLYERGPEIGFAQLRQQQTGEPPILLRDLSLRDALATITAKHRDRLIWSYMEYTCNGTTYSQFNWLSK